MIFVYIENYSFLTKVIDYLNKAGINYTTDLDSDFSYILLAEINSKTLKFIEEHPGRKIIFMTELEESKILYHFTSDKKSSKNYRNRYLSFISKCHKLIVSMPYFKGLFSKYCKQIEVIPNSLPIINISRTTKDIYDKYNLSKRRKKIIVIDLYYDYLSYIYELGIRYPKYDFIYVGYKSKYLLTKKEKIILNDITSNISYISYIDFNIYSDLCNISYLIIDFNSYKVDRDYLYITLLLKKQLLLYDVSLYHDFLVPSKHCYFFKDKDELLMRLDKIINIRVMNLSENGYDLIKRYTVDEIVKKYRESLE